MGKLDNILNVNILKTFLKKNVNSIIFMLLLLIIVIIVTYYRILIQINIGPLSDSVVFMANALLFAGQGTGYSNLMLPPFFPFILSLVFRLGYFSTNTIFILDGLLFVFGVVGLFFFLKLRFNNFESVLGALLYSTFPIVIIYLGVGLSDLTSVSFTIWAFYFLVLAVKKNSKFYYLAFPFAMLSFLTRYNNALLIFPIFLYILINKDEVNFKDMLIGVIASIITIIPVLILFYEKYGSILYPFMNFVSRSTISISTPVSKEVIYYNTNVLFYLQKFIVYVGSQGFFILLIVVLGILLCIYKFKWKDQAKNMFGEVNLVNSTTKIKAFLIIFIGIVFFTSFGKTLYMVNEMLFFILAYLFYDLFKKLNLKDIDLHLLFLAWFMVFFIFHSIFVIKDSRYFILMAPPVAYFMILGLSGISNLIKIRIRNRNVLFQLISIILLSIMLISTVNQIQVIIKDNNNDKLLNEQIELGSQWLINYDPDYTNKNIYSDLWPNFSWYLKTNVKEVPIFKDNQTFLAEDNNYTFNKEDSNAFNNYLKTNNADYYLSIRSGLNLTSYKPIKQFENVTIYKRT